MEEVGAWRFTLVAEQRVAGDSLSFWEKSCLSASRSVKIPRTCQVFETRTPALLTLAVIMRIPKFHHGVRLATALFLVFAANCGPSYGFDHLGAQSIRSRFWLGICTGLAFVVLVPVVLYGRVWQKVAATVLGIICGWAFCIAISYLHLKATR